MGCQGRLSASCGALKHRYGDAQADHLKQPQHTACVTAWGEAVGEMEALGVMENKHGVK